MNSKAFAALGARSMTRLRVQDCAHSEPALPSPVPSPPTDVPMASFEQAEHDAAAHAGSYQVALDRLTHTCSTLPLDAFRALDLWCGAVLQVSASTSTLAPQASSHYVQFDECVTTAKLWHDLKAQVSAKCATFVMPALAMDGVNPGTVTAMSENVSDTLDAFRRQCSARGWLYHAPSAMLFQLVHGGSHVDIVSTLSEAMRDACYIAGPHASLVVNMAVAQAHAQLVESGRTLRVDARVLLFADTIVSMASDGLALRKVDVLPRIDVMGPAIAARCACQTRAPGGCWRTLRPWPTQRRKSNG